MGIIELAAAMIALMGKVTDLHIEQLKGASDDQKKILIQSYVDRVLFIKSIYDDVKAKLGST